MANDLKHPLRRSRIVNLSWVAALALIVVLAYLLSYPVAVRWTGSSEPPGYRPAEWLIDHTPIQKPMLRWADLCGTGKTVRLMSVLRLFEENADPDQRTRPLAFSESHAAPEERSASEMPSPTEDTDLVSAP